VRPVPRYFGPPDARLFGWIHHAQSRADRPRRDVAVVVCNPIGDDYVRAHRTLRHLAEELVATGFPVLRFDFHGTGDSGGAERDPDRVAAWHRDVATAIDFAKAEHGVDRVAIVGLRFGATIAADVAATRGDVASVVLWHAFTTGEKFASETLKMHKMHRLLEPESFAAGPKSYPDGEEALGFFLTNQTLQDLKTVDLRALARRPAPHALVVDASNLPSDRPIVEKLEALGAQVEHRHMPGHKFLISIPHHSTLPDEVIAQVVTSLDAAHPAAAASLAPTAGSATPAANLLETARYTEEPVLFGPGNRLFGIHVRPRGGARNASCPAILMLNAGTVHRIGPHRFYVTMARELAELGFDVLRVDLSGIGDSPNTTTPENITYPGEAETDVRLAMDAMTARTGASRFVLAGLCSGADIAFQLGIKERRVASVVMMNPRTFLVHDLATVDANKGARYYQDSLFKKEKWVKLIKGEVDVVRAARMVAPKLKTMAIKRATKLVDRFRGRADQPQIEDVPSALRAMAERGVDTFLVVTIRDPGVDFIDTHYGEGMKGLAAVKNFRREDLAGTDHTFTSVWSQSHVKQTVKDHLTRRHLA
jgi:pimeloyl-ACP methyl ester carboxylesterase